MLNGRGNQKQKNSCSQKLMARCKNERIVKEYNIEQFWYIIKTCLRNRSLQPQESNKQLLKTGCQEKLGTNSARNK